MDPRVKETKAFRAEWKRYVDADPYYCSLACRSKGDCASCRFYFAGSSEMFGKVAEIPRREATPFHPRSAYGISKVAGFDLTRNYREAYGMHASSGILFNHESPRRGYEFVTRKITAAVADIVAGRPMWFALGTWTQNVTGATPGITCKPCG
jgi:GDP-mannose 4,6-dehydratase